MKEMNYEDVEKLLSDNDLYGEIDQPLYNNKYMANAVFDIKMRGDWKHEHGFLRYLMEQNDYYETQNNIVHDEYDNGSDFYTSIHRFVYKPFYVMFNGELK